MSEVISGLMDRTDECMASGFPVGLIPSGTANAMANELDRFESQSYVELIGATALMVAGGATKPVDVIHMTKMSTAVPTNPYKPATNTGATDTAAGADDGATDTMDTVSITNTIDNNTAGSCVASDDSDGNSDDGDHENGVDAVTRDNTTDGTADGTDRGKGGSKKKRVKRSKKKRPASMMTTTSSVAGLSCIGTV